MSAANSLVPEPALAVPKSAPVTPSTIGEDTARYLQEGRSSISPALRVIINQMIDGKQKTEFANDSYLDALYLTDVMFARSKETVRWLTGSGLDRFLVALEKPFRDMLERLRVSGKGSVNIVLLDRELPARLAAMTCEFKGILKIRRAASDEEIRHFIVCDSRMARVEEPHPPLTENSPATAIRARVYFNEPVKAKVFEDFFDSIWAEVGKFAENREVPDAALHPS